MDLDMIGGKYTKGNAAPAVSFFTGSCSPDSAGNNLFLLFGW